MCILGEARTDQAQRQQPEGTPSRSGLNLYCRRKVDLLEKDSCSPFYVKYRKFSPNAPPSSQNVKGASTS